MINEQKDRKLNPYYRQLEDQMVKDDYSEESDADSVWVEGTNINNKGRQIQK